MLYIVSGAVVALCALIPLCCRMWQGLADAWMRAVFTPVVSALSSLCARCPFPVAEPLALLVAALALVLLFRSRRWACLLLSCVLAGYALLWAPAYFATQRHAVNAAADAEALAGVCAQLADRLNQYGAYASPDDLPARALEAAALVDTPAPVRAAPKYARYPEWMRLFSLAGLFVPWTGEALLDPGAADAAQPFTAVHELMHMGGVADEGQANIYAYIACQRMGGAFARSADLWAFKYAMELLSALEGDAWASCFARLSAEARADALAVGGALTASDAQGGVCLPGASQKTNSYAQLALWLCDAASMNA